MKTRTYKINLTKGQFFSLLSEHLLDKLPKSTYSTDKNSNIENQYFLGVVDDNSANASAFSLAKKQSIKAVNQITAEQFGSSVDVTIKSSLDIKTKLYLTLFVIIFAALTYFVIYFTSPELFTEFPFLYFLPLIDIIGLPIIFYFAYISNIKVFYKRFENIFKEYIIK